MGGRGAHADGPAWTRLGRGRWSALRHQRGGPAVTTRDVPAGPVLPPANQTGPTGDPGATMHPPPLPTDQTYSAKAPPPNRADLVRSNPPLTEVVGGGPLNFPAAKRRASKT